MTSLSSSSPPADVAEAAERAHAAQQQHCPVARTLRGAVEILTELTLGV
jgi:uncharacterized OsmC-like protein